MDWLINAAPNLIPIAVLLGLAVFCGIVGWWPRDATGNRIPFLRQP